MKSILASDLTFTRPGTRITIDQVAAAARVGRTTVADIVNRNAGHKYRDQTRKHVLATARRLGYVASGVAQTVARGRSGQVGLMLTRDFHNPYWARVTAEVESRLRRRGLFLELAITDGQPQRERELIKHLYGQHIEGLIVGPVYEDRAVQGHHEVFRGSIPIVAFGGPITGFDVVGSDHGTARRLAVEHLLHVGHRYIGYLCLPDDGGPEGDGLNITAFRAAVRLAGFFDPSWVVCQGAELPVAEHAQVITEFARRWRSTDPRQRPTAMVCHNDRVALIALSVFHRLGIRVPHDLSLVGLDNLPETEIAVPPLTTLDSRVGEQMERALQLLLDEPRKADVPPRCEAVVPTLVSRESVKPVTA
jgi:DNA-binding LacI/PurR family transcriptional regulator